MPFGGAESRDQSSYTIQKQKSEQAAGAVESSLEHPLAKGQAGAVIAAEVLPIRLDRRHCDIQRAIHPVPAEPGTTAIGEHSLRPQPGRAAHAAGISMQGW